MIYFFVFTVLVLFSVVDFCKLKATQKKYLVLISFIILLLFSGLRWKTGLDWPSYFSYFTTLKRLVPFEPGFQLFNQCVHFFSNDYTVFLLVLTCVGLLLDYYFIRCYSPFPLISILIFYSSLYFEFFSGIRVAIAIGLCLLATHFLINRNIFLFFLIVFTATAFHMSAFIFLIAFFFRKVYISNSLIIFLFFLAFVVSYFQVVNAFVTFVISHASDSAVVSKLNFYLNSEYSAPGLNGTLQNILAILKRSLFLIIFIVYRKQVELRFDRFNVFFNLYIISILIYVSTMGNIEMLKRCSIFFLGFEIILLPMVISSVNKRNQVIIFAVTILYSLFRLILVLNTYPELYYPYKSIFWFDDSIIRHYLKI
jgi:hypothetical protein